MQTAFPTPIKRKKWPWIVLSILLFFVLLGSVTFALVKHWGIEGILRSTFIRTQVVDNAEFIKGDLFDLLPEALGFVEPKTYLLLFLNNTELRPGGGFIGVYAAVTLDHGNIEVHGVGGTESLDWNTAEGVPVAPDPLAAYLSVNGWYFRDSNWSPDFRESSKQGLNLYVREKGIAAGEVDAVVGVTATVLEEVMKRAGSITVDGITFTPENVIAELEHEVEYNFLNRGIARGDRKDIIQPLMLALIDKLKFDILRHPVVYRTIVEDLIAQKHVIAYALDSDVQSILHAHKADGAILDFSGDYLAWVDANLGALKTDHAINRVLSYTILSRTTETGERYFEAQAKMTYEHTGTFDWRTTRYRTYARVYVPTGSELISVESSVQVGEVDSETDLGKQWFGTFVSIEPGTTKSLTLRYRLPRHIQEQIEKGVYTLLVQKQIGLTQSRLTLDLDFDTTIQSATPAEISTEWGNDTYRIETPFTIDQEFRVVTQ